MGTNRTRFGSPEAQAERRTATVQEQEARLPLCEPGIASPIAPSVPAGPCEEEGRLRRAPIQVRPSPLGGRGVFAAKPIREGALLEECPVIIIDGDCEAFGDYIFVWSDGQDRRHALPLGYGACYNHSSSPNAHWQPDESRALMIIWAVRDIAADEEILISYGPGWFKTRGLHPAQESGGQAGSAPRT